MDCVRWKAQGCGRRNRLGKVAKLLELNKSKSYRKPRGNVALLSGLLICGNCGDYMRLNSPTAGTQRPRRFILISVPEKKKPPASLCHQNVSGNTLDADIMARIKMLSEDSFEFVKQLEQSKAFSWETEKRTTPT
jgi:hypothetical protein